MEELFEKYRKNEHLHAPEGYFESLPDEVLSRVRLDDAREKSRLAEEKLVPAGYFESLPDEILAQVRLDDARERSRLTEEKLVPAGYFESLPDDVVARIRLDEVREKARSAEEESVPAGYFEALPDQVMAAIAVEENRLAFRRRWARIASIAASGLIVVGIGLFAGLHFANHNDTQLAKQETVKKVETPVVEETPRVENTLLAAADIPAEKAASTASRKHHSAKAPVDKDLVAIGDFTEEELDGVDYDLLEMFSDDYALADFWEL